MEAREYFQKEYGHKHIETVVEMQDWVSLYGMMDEFAEWKVKNCSIPDVVGQSEQLLCDCCEDNVVEEQGDWCNDCLDNPSRVIAK